MLKFSKNTQDTALEARANLENSGKADLFWLLKAHPRNKLHILSVYEVNCVYVPCYPHVREVCVVGLLWFFLFGCKLASKNQQSRLGSVLKTSEQAAVLCRRCEAAIVRLCVCVTFLGIIDLFCVRVCVCCYCCCSCSQTHGPSHDERSAGSFSSSAPTERSASSDVKSQSKILRG